MNWKGVDSNARCDKTRQNSLIFFLIKKKESCARKRGGGEKEGRGRGERYLTFFKGIINSLSALVITVVPCIIKHFNEYNIRLIEHIYNVCSTYASSELQ